MRICLGKLSSLLWLRRTGRMKKEIKPLLVASGVMAFIFTVISIGIGIANRPASATGKAFLESELIFPLEHWHNHASCIVEAADGDLLVCWFHGSGERTADDVKISNDTERGRNSLAVAVSDDEGLTWKWKRRVGYEPPRGEAGGFPHLFNY